MSAKCPLSPADIPRMSSPPKKPAKTARPDSPLRSEFADDPDMAELLVYFMGELQQRADRLNTAWQNANHDDLQMLAHQIRGAAGGYGFPTVTKSAAELEQALMSDETQVALLKEKVEDLIALCRRAASGA